jgi:hypothetical protein
MANVTGGDDQNYSRRGRASRFYEEQTDPNFFQRFMGRMQGMGQSMASAVGLEGEQAPDPRVTGNVIPDDPRVTTGGGGRGSGGGSSRVTGSDASGGGGGGRAPVTGTNQRPPVDPSRNLLMDRNQLLGGALSNRNLGRYATYGPMAVDGLAGGLLAPALGGMAESAKAKLTGQEIAGRPGSISAQSGQRQKGREEALKDAALQAEIAQRYGGAYLQPTLQAMQDLRQNDVDMMIQSENVLIQLFVSA